MIWEEILANTLSAKKRIRQNAKRRMRNRVVRGRTRTAVKQARIAIDSGDAPAAVEAVKLAIIQLDRTANKGVIHRKNAARRKSRLMKRLAELEMSS
jgi:small subunit ribosomal protein S20